MNIPTPLSPLADPVSLSKIPILFIPVHNPSTPISQAVYSSYLDLIKRYQTLRGDELSRPHVSRSRNAGGADLPPNPRLRFFPPSTGNSISVSRGATTNHVHLEYVHNPPAQHLYPLSLLRMAGFPLIVLGLSVEPDPELDIADDGHAGESSSSGGVRGYSLEESTEEEDEGSGDITDVPTPTAPTFRREDFRGSIPSPTTSTSRQQAQRARRPVDPDHAFSETISSIFPSTSPFPLVKRLLVVPNQIPRSPSSPRKQGSVPVPSGRPSQKDKGYMRYAPSDGVGSEGWLGRVLGEVVGELLGELGEIATALETPAGMRTLSSTLLPSLTATLPHPELNSILSPHRSSTPNEYPSRPSSSTPVNIPHSASLDHLSGMGISLTRSLTPGGRPTSIQPPSLPPMPTSISPAPQPAPAASSNPFRRSTALSSPFSRTSSAASTTSSSSPVNSTQIGGPTKYTNATLSGVAGGRLMKLLGDFYLLAGLYGDAIRCFDDGAERCRSVGDVLWEGAAREGRAVAGIGEAWEGRDGSNLAQPFPTSPIPVEILSHYLSSLACLSRSPLPYPPTILSPSPQAVSGSISFPASSTFNPSNVGTGEGLLAYLHTGLSLRITHFVLLIWAAGGWGSIALSSLMTHTLPRSFPPPLQSHETTDLSGRRRRHRSLALLSATSQLSRQSVFAHVEQALGPHHRAMTKTEQLTIHTEAIWLARWLDLPRKESAITRDVIKRLAILIVEGREENRRMGAAGFSRTKMATPTSALLDENKSDAAAAAVGLGLGLPVASQNVAIRRKESTEGNSGIVALFERACQVMGIDLLSFDHDDFATSSHKHTHSITQHDSDSPSSTTKREPRFGWPELQVELLKDGITVSESLPDHPSIIRLALSALNGLHGYLNPQSQGMLSKMYPSALATARRRGMDIGGMPWWIPGKIVLSIEVSGLSPNKVPIQHSREEIAIKEGKKDPFLYNPRLKAAEGGTTVIVANEQIDVFVTVRNPFTFDLEIQDLSILTSGVPFITSPLPLTLPGSSIQTVRVTGHSPTPGSMQIKGISIRLNDGASTEILIPIMDVSEKQKRDKRKSRIQTDLGKVKRQGLDARFAILEKVKENDGEAEVFEGAKWIECKVVDELPLAWIKRTTLTHGTVMLYHGETSVIRITLENASSVPIDFVKLTFDDSTAREAAAIIQEGELTPEQAYEIEWDQLKRPVFVWERDDKEQTIIPPGGRTTLSVRCLGKVGCTDGTIRIDYGCINRRSRPRSSIDSQTDGKPVKAEEAEKTFYTRQISFPILFTVYHMLECPSLDLVRLGGSSGPSSSSQVASRGLRSAEMNGRVDGKSGQRTMDQGDLHTSLSSSWAAEDVLRQVLEEENDSDHCLLALSVKNIFGVPFEVTLARKADEKDLHQRLPLACTRLVPPGATERLIISLPRQSIPQSDLSQPIPSLSERQYIVDKEKKSVSRLHRERELFWYREKLLDLVSASWQEPGSNRRGTLSLRDQYFASDLLQVLKSDGVEVNVTLTYDNGAKNIQAMDFVGVSVKITNKLERPFRPYIHLAPLPSSHSDTSWAQAPSSTHHPSSGPGSASARPNSLNTQHQYQNQNQNQGSKNVLFDGLSSAALDDVLESGQTAEWTLGACFLVSGDYGLRAAVEEHGAQDDKEEEEEDGSTLNKGKKIWFSDVLNVRVD